VRGHRSYVRMPRRVPLSASCGGDRDLPQLASCCRLNSARSTGYECVSTHLAHQLASILRASECARMEATTRNAQLAEQQLTNARFGTQLGSLPVREQMRRRRHSDEVRLQSRTAASSTWPQTMSGRRASLVRVMRHREQGLCDAQSKVPYGVDVVLQPQYCQARE
jgi:hypothetical protein